MANWLAFKNYQTKMRVDLYWLKSKLLFLSSAKFSSFWYRINFPHRCNVQAQAQIIDISTGMKSFRVKILAVTFRRWIIQYCVQVLVKVLIFWLDIVLVCQILKSNLGWKAFTYGPVNNREKSSKAGHGPVSLGIPGTARLFRSPKKHAQSASSLGSRSTPTNGISFSETKNSIRGKRFGFRFSWSPTTNRISF